MNDKGKTDARVRFGILVRLRLRRTDGAVYLDRWGIRTERFGGILLHRMTAPDPDPALHDHPWDFWSIILKGGYTEIRADTREAPDLAKLAVAFPRSSLGGVVVERRPWTVKRLRFDECHTITALHRAVSWSLIIRGPRRRNWGFYETYGWVPTQEHYRELDVDNPA